MKKLEFRPRTLDEDIIRDGLCAVSNLENYEKSKNLTFVVGGVANQSYLPTSCRRGTSDIDLAVLRPLTHSQFLEVAKPALEYFSDKGYHFETKKGHSSYQIIYNNSKSEAAVIEFARRSQNNYDRIAKRMEREFENTRLKVVEERKETCRFCSPEDIVIPKLVRGVGSLKRNPSLGGYLNQHISFPLSDEDIALRLNKLFDLRQEAIMHIGDPLLSEELRFVSDIYDIQVLSESIGFNEAYIKKVVSDWDVLKNNENERNILFKNIFPKLELNNQ